MLSLSIDRFQGIHMQLTLALHVILLSTYGALQRWSQFWLDGTQCIWHHQ